MRNWSKKSASERNDYCNIFSPSNWKKLSEKSKSLHDVSCRECPKLEGHGMFPSSCNRFKAKRNSDVAYSFQEVRKTIKKLLNLKFRSQ